MPNQTLVYALACLRELLWHRGKAVDVAKIARDQAVPVAYCQKVLHALARAGIVTSVKGQGFVLDRAIETITVAEIMEALESRRPRATNGNGHNGRLSSLEAAFRRQVERQMKTLFIRNVLVDVAVRS